MHIEKRSGISVLVGALITICILIFLSYLTQSPTKTDQLQKSSLLAFSFALPGLSLLYYDSRDHKLSNLSKKHFTFTAVIFIASSLSALIGIGLTMWRYYDFAGFIFLAVSLILLIIHVKIEGPEK